MSPVLMPVTSPTLPRSMISGGASPFSSTISSLRALMSLPSLPESPTAMPPLRLIRLTMFLLTLPTSTISTTSMVASSVTRRPWRNSLVMPSCLSMLPICGPPPCTMTGLMPMYLSRMTLRAKLFCRASSTMACPPYLITTVLPKNLRIYGRASSRSLALACSRSMGRPPTDGFTGCSGKGRGLPPRRRACPARRPGPRPRFGRPGPRPKRTGPIEFFP
ncbi:hypothetical protein DSECCO2_613170 [anaerobic digester metagenome]